MWQWACQIGAKSVEILFVFGAFVAGILVGYIIGMEREDEEIKKINIKGG